MSISINIHLGVKDSEKCVNGGVRYTDRIGERLVEGTAGWLDCLSHCKEDSGCNFWTLDRARCWLMSNFQNTEINAAEAVSGSKLCETGRSL